MPVTITINGDDAGHALVELKTFAGGMPQTVPAATPPQGEQQADKPRRAPRGGKAGDTGQAAEPQQNIQTGGERVDPNAGKGDEKPAEQPKAPEAKPLTLDAVRTAAQPYIDKWEMAAAGVDLAAALKDAIGKEKISQLDATNQAELAAAVKAFTEAYGDGSKRYVPKAK